MAKHVYDLPERIAVMCSMQELQDIWVPGRLRCDESHKFCQAAVDAGAKKVANYDNAELTRAIQDVQRFDDAYGRWFDASQAFVERG